MMIMMMTTTKMRQHLPMMRATIKTLNQQIQQKQSGKKKKSTTQYRAKRPTPMDLAWRQVALDEAAGRLPPFVAETKADKIIERVGEQNKRDGEELRRIRQLSATDDDAYLDALGEYLDRRRSGSMRKKGSDDGKGSKRRKKDGADSPAIGKRADDNASVASSSSSSSSDSDSDGDAVIQENGDTVGSAGAKKKSPIELLSSSSSSSSSSEDEDDDDAPLGSVLALKWKGQAELLSLAKENQCFVVQVRIIPGWLQPRIYVLSLCLTYLCRVHLCSLNLNS